MKLARHKRPRPANRTSRNEGSRRWRGRNIRLIVVNEMFEGGNSHTVSSFLRPQVSRERISLIPKPKTSRAAGEGLEVQPQAYRGEISRKAALVGHVELPDGEVIGKEFQRERGG